jgi:uncharacterized protein
MLPGVSVEIASPPREPEPLRSDIAGFIGGTRRGLAGEPVRIVGWSEFERLFGGLVPTASTPYAVHGYFDNGGEIAWVVRTGRGTSATATWDVRGLAGFTAEEYTVVATSPGCWGNAVTVNFAYRASGVAGARELDIRITSAGEPAEVFASVPPADVERRLAASLFVRLVPPMDPRPPNPPTASRRSQSWALRLAGGADAPPDVQEYLGAVTSLADEPEVALMVVPDLDAHLAGADRDTVMAGLLDRAAEQLDRLVVLDLPPAAWDATGAVDWARERRQDDPTRLRAAVAYHPPVRVRDPLRGAGNPLRTVPASGHVAGLISRLDRERGAHYTPANAVLEDAVDLEPVFDEAEQVAVYEAGLNLVRCRPGVGLQVWGGRTLDLDDGGQFVAHRRLLHRLVRAIRRVAEPLVFDDNTPELRLTLVRGITSVLLEAFRSGALRGARPNDAFRVVCDDSNNPLEQHPGLVVCDVEVAPAIPMEFIRIRLALGQEGRLEVTEA